MGRFARASIVAVALALPLGGCVNFDPADWFAGDWFSTKKPLPGERKDLFPGGVPGVSRGVPADLIKGNQAAALQDQQEETPVRVDEPKAKAKAKPKPKPRVVEDTEEPEQRRPTPVTVRPQPQVQPQAQPQPQPQAQPRPQQSQSVQWPDPPGTMRPQQQGTQWPDPPMPR